MNRRTVIAGSAATLAVSAMPAVAMNAALTQMGNMRVYAPFTADKIIAGYKSAWGVDVSHLRDRIDKVVNAIHQFEVDNNTPFPIAGLLTPYLEENGAMHYPIIYRENGDPLDWRREPGERSYISIKSIPDDPANRIEGNRIAALGFKDDPDWRSGRAKDVPLME